MKVWKFFKGAQHRVITPIVYDDRQLIRHTPHPIIYLCVKRPAKTYNLSARIERIKQNIGGFQQRHYQPEKSAQKQLLDCTYYYRSLWEQALVAKIDPFL